jgi:transcriptional regulator with XRE-family HTH domain
MTDRASPAVGRRKLAGELRRLRSVAGLTIQAVAERLECSAGKVSRIETGAVGVRVQDVRDMLALYRVPAGQRDELLDLVRLSRTREWWQDYLDVVPADSGTLFGLEAGAACIDHNAIGLVPGLLQTEPYARALMTSLSDVPHDVAERRLELRMRRQRLLSQPEPPQLRVLLDESVLHRLVGGAEVMAGQLGRLAEAATLDHVQIQVVPFAAGAYPAAGLAYSIFGFAGPSAPDIVYLEQLTRNTHLDDPSEVAFYRGVFADATARARTPADSIDILRELVCQLG